MTDEKTLLLGLQRRDEAALGQAVERYTPYLNTVLFRAVGTALSREDQEEIVSDVFVSLWQNAERIDLGKGTLRGYMAAAARNLACKRLRRAGPALSLEELSAAEEPADPGAPARERALWDSVAELGEQDCELFVRYYKYGESLRQIAAATGLKLSTVKTRLSRGKRKLKQILEDAEGWL